MYPIKIVNEHSIANSYWYSSVLYEKGQSIQIRNTHHVLGVVHGYANLPSLLGWEPFIWIEIIY